MSFLEEIKKNIEEDSTGLDEKTKKELLAMAKKIDEVET